LYVLEELALLLLVDEFGLGLGLTLGILREGLDWAMSAWFGLKYEFGSERGGLKDCPWP
jgi:hypothetical protein